MSTLHFAGPDLHLRTPAAAVHFLLTGVQTRAGRHCAQRPSAYWETATRTGPADILARVNDVGTALRVLRSRAGFSRRQAARIADTRTISILLIELGNMRLLTVPMLFLLSSAYSEAIPTEARP